MKSLIFSLIAPVFISSFAMADIEEDFEGLGGNKVLLEKAQALNPDTQIWIVQDRIVPRRNRWELAPEYSGSFGGDSYVKVMNLGLNVQYHITPRWSVGLKYNKTFNKLTPEGDRMVSTALDDFERNPDNPTAPIPDLDYQKDEKLVLLNWYPIYGKMNLLDKGIAQFDFYGLLGGGQVTLASGPTSTYTLGGGFGFWWTRSFSTRLEMRYQNYKAQFFDGEKSMDLALASLQMGWML